MIYDLILWIYDKITGKDHNARFYTPDGKIKGYAINYWGWGLAEDFSSCTPEILEELAEMVDNRRKELLAQ